jgi:hypothetical protein
LSGTVDVRLVMEATGTVSEWLAGVSDESSMSSCGVWGRYESKAAGQMKISNERNTLAMSSSCFLRRSVLKKRKKSDDNGTKGLAKESTAV